VRLSFTAIVMVSPNLISIFLTIGRQIEIGDGLPADGTQVQLYATVHVAHFSVVQPRLKFIVILETFTVTIMAEEKFLGLLTDLHKQYERDRVKTTLQTNV
jgi:hypothetical protein